MRTRGGGTKVIRAICALFYDPKYLQGKFFDDKKMGFVWALKAIPRSFRNKRSGITYPIGKDLAVLNGKNIQFHPNSINVLFQKGCYYQAFAPITIGKDVWVAQNVGIITANHRIDNPEEHAEAKPVSIGDNCWIGMNAVILPGVTLGPHTVVGAGSVVTKSFASGHCVIVGNPARKIKDIT